LLDEPQPSVELNRLREASGLTNPYIIVQAAQGLEHFLRFVKTHSDRLRDYQLVALPIGPVLGDHEAILGDDLPGLVRLPVWPHPLLLAELIRGAAAVVGHSYHLAISALAFGVPVFSSADLSVGKYTSLSGFETIFPLPNETETDAHLFITRLGRTAPSEAARTALNQLGHHWDRIAAIIREGATDTGPALDRFWLSLPGALETEATRQDAAVKASEAQNAERQRRIDELTKLLALARVEIAGRDDRIARLYNSPSWRVTEPARYLMRALKRLVGK
jgi:lipopolysaccharide transport system ATP-binding protein